MTCSNICPQKAQIYRVYDTWLWQRNMKNKEHARRDELDSLKVNMARIVSLLEQALSFYPRHKWDPCKSFREEADQNWKIEPTPIVFKK